MEDQAKNVLLNLLQKANEGIDAAVTFSKAQIPDVIHQLLLWHFFHSLIIFALGIVFISLGNYVIYRLAHVVDKKLTVAAGKAKADYDSGEPWTRYSHHSSQTSTSYDFITGFPRFVTFIIAAVASLLTTMVSVGMWNLTWLKIWIAPKLYLLEYAASLVK